ncbi:MAG: hypothetical protein ACI4RA_03155 [Kiritimatiellia bacterium]
MKIVYQGQDIETEQTSVAGFLSERGVDAAQVIVEYAGEVYPPGTDLAVVPLVSGKALDVFRLTAGG